MDACEYFMKSVFIIFCRPWSIFLNDIICEKAVQHWVHSYKLISFVIYCYLFSYYLFFFLIRLCVGWMTQYGFQVAAKAQ